MSKSRICGWLKSCAYIWVILTMVLILLPAPAFALDANTLEAEIDGVPVTFYLENAVIQSWGKLNASYVSYNPRGEKEYRLLISLPPSIEPGAYDFSAPGSSFTLFTQYYPSRGRWGVDYDTSYANGSGSFSITGRNGSWTHYQGTFDLSMEYTRRHPNKTVQGSFDFTIGESFQTPAPAETDTTPSVEPALPTAEPPGDTTSTEPGGQAADSKPEDSIGVPDNEGSSIPEPPRPDPMPSDAPTLPSEGPSDDMPADITPQAEQAGNGWIGSYFGGSPKPSLSSSEDEGFDTYNGTNSAGFRGGSTGSEQKGASNFLSPICYAGGILVLITAVVYRIRGTWKKD